MRGFQDPSLTNCYRGGACGSRITKYIIQTHPYFVVSRLGYCRNVQRSYEDFALEMSQAILSGFSLAGDLFGQFNDIILTKEILTLS